MMKYLILIFTLFMLSGQGWAATECNDGVNNDPEEDALIDMADPDCTSLSDDHEGKYPVGFFKSHSTWYEPIPANPVVMYDYEDHIGVPPKQYLSPRTQNPVYPDAVTVFQCAQESNKICVGTLKIGN